MARTSFEKKAQLATYEYRCDIDGAFDVMRPFGTAPATVACTVCGRESQRVFSIPFLPSSATGVMAALDRAEKSRHEPDVVTSLPSAGPRRRAPAARMTPALQRLPRP